MARKRAARCCLDFPHLITPSPPSPPAEGRLEGGNLSCAYHGWEFSGSGACQRIPQADSPESAAAACNNPRSCAKRHPTQVRHGLLFAWGESGPTAELEAMGAPVPVMKELDEDANRERLTIVADWFTSIVPYRSPARRCPSVSPHDMAPHGPLRPRPPPPPPFSTTDTVLC